MNFSHQNVPPTDWKIDPTYQRSIKAKHVARLVKDFDPAMLGVFILSHRADGSYYIVDGQHRAEALRLRNITTPQKCVVFEGLAPADEARMFWQHQNARKSQTALEGFRALAAAGDPEAKELQQRVRDFGFIIGNGSADRNVRCITNIQHLAKQGQLDRTFEILTPLIRQDKRWNKASVFAAIGGFFNTFPHADPDRLWGVLEKRGVVNVLQEIRFYKSANPHLSISLAGSRVFMLWYNEKLRANRRLAFPENISTN